FINAFADVAKQARPNDVVVIFLSGHGISLGINNSEYCYLTREARTLDKYVFSDPELRRQQLITSEELKDLMTKIPSLKRVMIFDTCEAGAAASDLAMAPSVSGDQVRALERLKDRTGFHILMGAAASKASYEHSAFGQGLLPYALILGIKGAGLRDDKYVDVMRLFSFAQDEVPRLAESIGIKQQPHIMAKEGASFDIGLLERGDREQIKLAQAKPFILPPQLTNPAVSYDNLELSRDLREALREACLKNEINAVFVAAEEQPGAVRPRGNYQVVRATVKVKVVLIKDGKPAGETEIEGMNSDLAGLIKRLIKALGPEIDKLSPK